MSDWQVSKIVEEHVKLLEEHAKRVGFIVDQATKRFNADYTGFVAGFCALIIAGSIAITLAGAPAEVSIAGMVVGGIGLTIAMTYRYLNRCQHAKVVYKLAEFERERLHALRRAATMNSVRSFGLPEGTPLAQLQILLGDAPTAFGSDGMAATWKALPSAKVGDTTAHDAEGIEEQEET